jgi:glucose-6-phosphate-specific signal transduction histidine kinase
MIAPSRIQTRPAQVAKATGLVCLSLAIGLVRVIISWRLEPQDFPFILTAFISALNVLLIWKIWQGRNWARTTLFVIFVIALMLTANALVPSFRVSPVRAILGIVQLVIWVCALSLVYGSKAEGWFQSKETQVL